MKIARTIIVFFVSSINFFAQEDSSYVSRNLKKNAISFEAGGTGLLYSFGYERSLRQSENYSHSMRIACSYPFIGGLDYLLIPFEYNMRVGKNRNKLLIGAGIINLIGTSPSPAGSSAQNDYRKLYNSESYTAMNKYNTDHFNSSFDITFIGKLGYIHSFEKIDLYGYYNCFYIRFTYKYFLSRTF